MKSQNFSGEVCKNSNNLIKMISIQNLSKTFEREPLFENINLTIDIGTKIAFVGKNGAGKTTFFNCLTGNTDFNGRILIEDIKISLMEQEKNFSNLNKTFEEYLEDKHNELEKRKKEFEVKIGSPESYENEEKFNSLMDEYNLLLTSPQFNIEQKQTKEILKELNIGPDELNQKINNLSGGQKTKLRLAECLARAADLYLLDEPTNNLDLKTKEWLESYIIKNIPSLIVISHDRYFLNKIIDLVWDLENKQIKEWKMNFSEYLKEKRIYLENLKKTYNDVMKEKQRLLDSSKEKRQWATVNRSRKLRVIADRLERDAKKLEADNPDDFIKNINVNFNSKNLHNCTIFNLEGVSMKFDKILFKDVNRTIDFGEKVCVMGQNGTGKSTFLKLLVGKIKPTGGDISIRKGLDIGYFDQELSDIDPNKTLENFLIEETGKNKEQLIPDMLRYGFEKEAFDKRINQFSGGEKGRINLLRIALGKKDVLILDEPTNNLDIYLLESLEKALRKFKGTVVFVSHDRYFVDNVATKILEIEGTKVNSFSGNYTDLLEFRKRNKT